MRAPSSMTGWIRLFALLLVAAPMTHAASDCATYTGKLKSDCESNLLLKQGMEQFKKKEYAAAQTIFQRILASYPQNGRAMAQARRYNAKCDRLRAQSRPAVEVLKFKPETEHGQVLSPGEKPPVSTIEDSQKDLSTGSTQTTPP